MTLRHPVVALVSSAGGLDASTRVVAGLPEALHATVLVLQHTSPDRESLLPQILSRRTGRQVFLAEDGSPLEPGAILVAPPGCHTLVSRDLRLVMIESGPFPPWRPSADLLLTTMAMALGPAAIAVVLSGQSHDAATGATAIHKMGGLVITSDEESSQHFTMPRSTLERDQIAPPALSMPEMVERLPELLRTVDLGAVGRE